MKHWLFPALLLLSFSAYGVSDRPRGGGGSLSSDPAPTCGADLNMNGYGIRSKDAPTTDTATSSARINLGQHANAMATTAGNKVGGDTYIGAGSGSWDLTCSAWDADADNDTLVITRNRSSSTDPSVTYTAKNGTASGAYQWNCVTNAATCCANLKAKVAETGTTVLCADAGCTNGHAYFQPDATTWNYYVEVVNSAGAVFGSLAHAADGRNVVNSSGIVFAPSSKGTQSATYLRPYNWSAFPNSLVSDALLRPAGLSTVSLSQTSNPGTITWSSAHATTNVPAWNVYSGLSGATTVPSFVVGTNKTDAQTGNLATLFGVATGMGGTAAYKFQINGDGQAWSRPYTTTIADNAGGTKATGTLEPATSNVVICDCDDADGCTMTVGETAAVAGMTAILLGNNATACEYADSAGVVELAGGVAFVQGANDTLRLLYTGSAWVEVSRADN